MNAEAHNQFLGEIERHLSKQPSISPSAFVAANATLVGDVTLGEECSVWYQAVLRGDINRIVIGARSNIQDGAVIHLASDFPAIVGEDVTVGHKAILHACTLGNEILVGMGAIVLDGAVVGDQCIIGAGALVTGGKKIPEGSLVLGSPARVVRALSDEERVGIRLWADRYVVLSRSYQQRGLT